MCTNNVRWAIANVDDGASPWVIGQRRYPPPFISSPKKRAGQNLELRPLGALHIGREKEGLFYRDSLIVTLFRYRHFDWIIYCRASFVQLCLPIQPSDDSVPPLKRNCLGTLSTFISLIRVRATISRWVIQKSVSGPSHCRGLVKVQSSEVDQRLGVIGNSMFAAAARIPDSCCWLVCRLVKEAGGADRLFNFDFLISLDLILHAHFWFLSSAQSHPSNILVHSSLSPLNYINCSILGTYSGQPDSPEGRSLL